MVGARAPGLDEVFRQSSFRFISFFFQLFVVDGLFIVLKDARPALLLGFQFPLSLFVDCFTVNWGGSNNCGQWLSFRTDGQDNELK